MKDSSLPKNRIDVFLDVFQMSWRSLVYISMFLGIFILPTILVVLFSQMAGLNILTNINSGNVDEVVNAVSEYYYHNINTILYLFPCFVIASFGLAGCSNVMKKIVWLDRYDFIEAFKQGVQGNIVKIIFNAIILTAIYAIGVLTYCYILFNDLNPFMQVLLILLSVLIMFFLINVAFFGYSQMVIYTNGLGSYLKNCLIFSIISFPKSSLVVLLALILVPISFLFESVVGIVIVYSFYLLIGFGYVLLLFTLNSHSIFDRLINKEHYPNIYKKGLSS